MADESNEQKGSRPARPAIPPFRGPGSAAKPPLAPPAPGVTRAPFLRPGARPATPTSPLAGAARPTPTQPSAPAFPPMRDSSPERVMPEPLPTAERALPSIEEFVEGGAAPTEEATVAERGPSWLDAAPSMDEYPATDVEGELDSQSVERLSPLAEEGLESAPPEAWELPPPPEANARGDTTGVVDGFDLDEATTPSDARLERADAAFPPVDALGTGTMGEIATTRTWSEGTEASSHGGSPGRPHSDSESPAAWSGDPSTWPTPVSNPAIPAAESAWGAAPLGIGDAPTDEKVGLYGDAAADTAEEHAPLAEDVIPATMELEPAIDAQPPTERDAAPRTEGGDSSRGGYSAYGEAAIYAQDAASDWEGVHSASGAMLSTGGEPIAKVLETLASRIRNGVLVVPEVNAPTDAAALAAVLGAVLGVRSGGR